MGSNFLSVLLFAFKWPILWISPQRQITPLNQKWFMYTLSLVLILKIWYGRKKTKNNATFPLPNQGLDLILGLSLGLIINLDHFESTNILLSIDKMASFPVSELRFSTFEQLFFLCRKNEMLTEKIHSLHLFITTHFLKKHSKMTSCNKGWRGYTIWWHSV